MAWNVKDFLEEQKRLEELKRKNAGAQITKEEALAKIKADAAKPVSMPKSTSGDAVYTPLPVYSKTAQEQAAVKRTAKTQPKSTRNEYYSQPEDIYAQTQELRARLAANEARVKNLQGRLENRKRAYELTGDKKYAEKYQREYKEYQSAIGQYGKDVNSYNAYTQAETQRYNDWRSTVRKPERVQLELDAYTAKIEQLEEQRTNIGKLLLGQGANLPAIAEQRRGRIQELNAQIEELSAKRNKLQEEYDWGDYLGYEDLRSTENFGESSKYKQDRGEIKLVPSTGMYTESSPGVLDYHYINKNKDAILARETNNAASGLSLAGVDKAFMQQMTNDEIAMFNYLWEEQSPEAALEYVKKLNGWSNIRTLNERQRMADVAEYKAYASEHPVQASIWSVLSAPGKSLGYIGQVADYIGDGKIDQNARYNRYSYTNTAIREQVGEKVKSKWGSVGSWTYNLGMSMADFLYTSAISGGNEALSLAIMGTSAAADTTISAKDRGLSDGQAIALGTIAGAAEAALEKMSFDKLFNFDWSKGGVRKYILENTLTEGMEEGGSNIINQVADILISREKSEWKKSIEEYKNAGLSEGKAIGKAFGDYLLSLGSDVLAGMISGGTLGSIGAGTHSKLRAAEQAQKNTAESGGVAKYSIKNTKNIPYEKQIDAYYGKENPLGRSDDVFVMDADDNLNDLQLGGKPFFMLKSNLNKSTRTEGNNKSNSAHDIPEDIVRKIPEYIKEPALVVIGKGRISVITDEMVKTKRENAAPLLIGINPNGTVDNMPANEIKTIYGVDGFREWLSLRARDSVILAGNQNKAEALLRDVGIQSSQPVAYATDLTQSILSQAALEVNNEVATEPAPNVNTGNEVLDRVVGEAIESGTVTKQNVSDALVDVGALTGLSIQAGLNLAGIEGYTEQRSAVEQAIVRLAELYGGRRTRTTPQSAAAGETIPQSRQSRASSLYTREPETKQVNPIVDTQGRALGLDGAPYAREGSGLVRDANYRKANIPARKARVLDAIAKVTGTKIRFVPEINGGRDNARYKDGVIEIALDCKNPVGVAFTHELVHRIRDVDPEAYEELKRYVYENMDEQSLRNIEEGKKKTYADKSAEDIQEEVVADAFGYILGDSVRLEQFVQDNRKTAEKIADMMRDLIIKIKRALRAIEEAGVVHPIRAYRLYDEASHSPRAASGKKAFAELAGDLDAMAQALSNALEATAQAVQDGTEQHATVGAKSSAKGIHGYNAFREKLAKAELDDLSRKLGDKFPLSANFDEAMKNDNTPLSVETIQVESVTRLPGESKYAAGKKAFKNAYGGNTDVHIEQLGIDVRLNTDVVSETLAKAYDDGDVQSSLDLIPKIKGILENGVLMQVERVGHLSNKKESLFGYRLYGAYNYVDANGNVTPKAVVCTVVQNLNDAYTHVFRDIENVTLKHGLTGAKDSAGISEEFEGDNATSRHGLTGAKDSAGISEQPKGGKYTIAQLYDAVKKIARKDGGLKYSDSEKNEMLFAYSETEEGEKYSSKADNDMYKALIEEYGEMKPGEKPARVVQVPKKTGEGKYVRRGARTIMEAGSVPDEFASEMEQEIVNGTFSYEPQGDKRTLERVNADIEYNGWEESMARWNAVVNGTERASKENIVLGETLLVHAANAGDTELAMKLAAELAAEATRAGQEIQAIRLLKKMSPEGRLYHAQKHIAKLQEEINERHGRGKYKIVVPKDMYENLINATTEEEMRAAEEALYTCVAEQMPSTLWDQWNAWRYIAMLANPRTHIKNLVGNLIFMPVRGVKNMVKIVLESAMFRKSNEYKTASIKAYMRNGENKELRKFIKADRENNDVLKQNNSKYTPENIISEKRKVFTRKWLAWVEWVRRNNLGLLEKSDMFFKRTVYDNSMLQYMLSNKYTAEFLQSGTREANRALERGRQYAIDEALKATYQDANKLAESLNKMTRFKEGDSIATKAGKVAAEGVLPFKKTPMNIVKRGVEYSPVGLIDGVYKAIAYTVVGKYTPMQAIDRIASGLTGTGLLLMGIWLASMGLLKGKLGDDKEDEFKKLQGEQGYAIVIGDHTYTLDWAAPAVLPLFVGVEIYEQMKSTADEDKSWFSNTLDALSNVTEPMLEMSMLQGLQDVIDNVSFSDNKLSAVITSALTSYVTQGVPTLFGQIARTVDPVRRSTYASKSSKITKGLEQTIRKIGAKIPGISSTLEPYVDEWGRDASNGGIVERALENFISPGYYSKKDADAVEQEIERLYKATSERSVLPKRAESSFSYKEKTYYKSPEELTKYQKTFGGTSYKLREAAYKDGNYKRLTDEEKVAVAEKIAEVANTRAKIEFFMGRDVKYEPDSFIEKLDAAKKAGVPEHVVIIAWVLQKDVVSIKNKDGEPVNYSSSLRRRSAIDKARPSLSLERRRVLYEMFDVGKDVIKMSDASVKTRLEAMEEEYAQYNKKKKGA